MNVIEYIISTIAPHECMQCGKEGSLLCHECQTALPPFVQKCYRCGRTDRGDRVCASCRRSTPLYALSCATAYDDVAKELVRGMKYGRKKAAAATIAEVMALRLGECNLQGYTVTYAPTASQRARMRGYDQAEQIARRLAQLLNLPYSSLLMRTGQQRQVGQRREARLHQMADAFRIVRSQAALPQAVLLVDDVITTGSTLEAAARALRQAGVGRVIAATFAAA